MKIVGVKVFGRGRITEEKVKHFED